MSRRASLTWVGFTKEGCVASYDSHYVVRALASVGPAAREWVVLMNVQQAMKAKSGQSAARGCGSGG